MLTIAVSDQDLVRAYLQGNEIALQFLIKKHHKRVFSTIFLLVKDKEAANDIFQDVFLKVINTLKAGKYNEEGKFLPWLLRIAHNMCIDYFRLQKKMPSIQVEEGKDVFDFVYLVDESIEDKLIKNQVNAKINQLIEHLPEEQKEVLVLRLYNDLSFKEIADLTNVSINTALGRMRYALTNLRKLLKKHAIQL